MITWGNNLNTLEKQSTSDPSMLKGRPTITLKSNISKATNCNSKASSSSLGSYGVVDQSTLDRWERQCYEPINQVLPRLTEHHLARRPSKQSRAMANRIDGVRQCSNKSTCTSQVRKYIFLSLLLKSQNPCLMKNETLSINSETHAWTLWGKIESLYASKCGNNKLFLLNSIVSLKFKKDASLSNHLNEFQGILD
ncbi:hypothetical protein CR513_23083, partial [Mucuna pruriens]